MGLAPLGPFVALFPPYTWLFVNSVSEPRCESRAPCPGYLGSWSVRFVLETCVEEEVADREARVGAAQVEIAANLGRLSGIALDDQAFGGAIAGISGLVDGVGVAVSAAVQADHVITVEAGRHVVERRL